MADILSEFILEIALIVVLATALVTTKKAVDMEVQREIFVLEDQADKSATALDINAAPGSREMTAEQVITTVLSMPLDVDVYVNNNQFSAEIRQQAIWEKLSIKPYVKNTSYEAYYEYGPDGRIIKAIYKSVS